MNDLSYKAKLDNLFSFYGRSTTDEFRILTEHLIKEVVNDIQEYKPILEIRIPFWSGLKPVEFYKFMERVEKVCDGKYLTFILPMRNNKISVQLNPKGDLHVEEFKKQWEKMMSEQNGQWFASVSNEALVTDIGTVRVHSVFNISQGEHSEVLRQLKAELESTLEAIK